MLLFFSNKLLPSITSRIIATPSKIVLWWGGSWCSAVIMVLRKQMDNFHLEVAHGDGAGWVRVLPVVHNHPHCFQTI